MYNTIFFVRCKVNFYSFFFFFSSRRRHTRYWRDWSSTCALPIYDGLLGYLGAVFVTLGQAAFGFLVPALAGYIAYAIADRPGIAPGFVVGAVAASLDAGFLGGLVVGIIAGLAALWISRWKLPTGVRGLQPVVIIPLLATLISSGLMVVLLARPLAAALSGLGEFLNGLDRKSVV